jgi:hypothetical protein
MRNLLVSFLLYGLGLAQSIDKNLIEKSEDAPLNLLLQEADSFGKETEGVEGSIVVKNGTIWNFDKEPSGSYYIIAQNETAEDYEAIDDGSNFDENPVNNGSNFDENPVNNLVNDLHRLNTLHSKLDLIETRLTKSKKKKKKTTNSKVTHEAQRSSRRRRRRRRSSKGSTSTVTSAQWKEIQDGVAALRKEITGIRDMVKDQSKKMVESLGGTPSPGGSTPTPTPKPTPKHTPKPTPTPTPTPSSGKGVGKFMYIRFVTVKVRRDKGVMQIADIKFRENGQDIKIVTASSSTNYPGNESPKHAIDKNCKTKFLDKGGYKKDKYKNALILQLDGKRAVDEMMIVTANDAKDRDPVQFIVEGSNDKRSWTNIYKSKSNENIPTRRFADTEWFELVPLDKVIEDREKEQAEDAKKEEKDREEAVPKPKPTPSPPPGPAPDPAKGPKYKFVKFSPLATRSDGVMQVDELKPMKSGQYLKVINAESNGGNSPANEGVKNCIDGKMGTKWLDFDKGLKGVTLELAEAAQVTGIEIVTANDVPGRDPVMFKVEGSHENTNDQGKWKLLYKSQFKEVLPMGRGQSIKIEFKEPKGCSKDSDCESKQCSDGKCKPAKPKQFCGGKEGWSSGNNGKCYKFMPHEPARVTFDTARSVCKKEGGDLDTFDNERDGNVHFDKCRYGKQEYGYTHYRTCWLGYSDRKQEGKIVSELDGSPRKHVGRYMDWNNWNKPDRDCPTLSRNKVG